MTEGTTTSGVNIQLAGVAPEIAVRQGANAIASGGSFGFGSKTVNTDTDAVFTVENTGDAISRSPGSRLSSAARTAISSRSRAARHHRLPREGIHAFTVRFRPTIPGANGRPVPIRSAMTTVTSTPTS